MSLTDDESYYFLGYANKKVKEEFKSFFRKFTTLEAALDSLIYLGDNLYNEYTFMDNDVKYKLRAKASTLDNPVKLNEVLLKWYSFVESSNYKSMGCVIEKILMVRKQITKKRVYQTCEFIEKSKKLAEISHDPVMFDNDGNLQSSAKPSPKQDHDDNTSEKDGNVPVVQSSDPAPASKDELSPSADFQNYKSVWPVEESEHFGSNSSTEDIRASFDGTKGEMLGEKADKLKDEEALTADEVVPADESDKFIKNTSVLRNSDDLDSRNATSNCTEVIDDSYVELSQQLGHFQLENDAAVGKNDETSVESNTGHVPKKLTVPPGTKTLVGELKCPKRAEKVDGCEESDSWGTMIDISSDSEASSDSDDNYQ